MGLFRQVGFSLIELIAVMVIAGVLATTVSIRFSASDIDLQRAKSDVLGALVFARELAMARTDGSAAVRLVTTATTIDVQVNNTSTANLHQSYPVTLPSGVSISTGVGSLDFNSLGETTSHSFILLYEGFSSTITVSGVGYAYE